MEFESDEMQKLIKTKMNQWKYASKLITTTTNAPQASQANISNKNKKQQEEKKGGQQKSEVIKSQFVNNTPSGQKKDMNQPIQSEYFPKEVESAWYSWWEQKKFFHANAENVLSNAQKKKFIMVIPPPNVTGALHLGHALMLSIEDALTRYRRMCGYETLWLPGVDHAGISTQSVVEKQIWKKEKKTRHDYGREAFVKKVWEWKEEYGNRIIHQFKRFGISVDWDRFAFTLDDKRYEAVMEAFVRMHEKGIVYRDTRLVNWSCAMRTALSDLEVEFKDITEPQLLKVPNHDPNKMYEFGWLTEFAYKIKGTDKEIVVATTRLETMLGDVAVAVHPNDPRYKDLIGLELQHPFIDDRIMKIIADDILVDMNFGTGAVKITPAHDFNDYKCGKRHNLQMINVFTEDGKIGPNGGKFAGMMRFDCRYQIQKELEQLGLLKGRKPNEMRLGFCSKSGDIIEPFLKPQWYVNCKELAQRSCDAVRKKELIILPEEHEKTWFDWLEKIQDWCVSRQLWWGHRIPAYLCKIPGVIDNPDTSNDYHYVVGRTEAEARKKAAQKFNVSPDIIELSQDEDVLDTWFSSGLFPFSTMGWPNNEHPDMKAFFPGDLLETGTDILFFWVARMVMMSLCLCDQLPFKYVFLHPMVRDEKGAKMSKSKGNVIDPLEVMDGCQLQDLLQKLYDSNLAEGEVKEAEVEKKKKFPTGIPECGTDALRFGLLSYMIQSSINLDVQRVVGYKQFCNKLWNIIKFALSNFPPEFQPVQEGELPNLKFSLSDKWILTRLSKLIDQTNANFEQYKFGEMVMGIYDFWLKELADVYIEALKPVMKNGTEQEKVAAWNALYICLDRGLKIMHPTMPYITEELFQRLPHNKNQAIESICIAPFPQQLISFEAEDTENKINLIMKTIKAFRSQMAALNIPKQAKPEIAIKCKSPYNCEVMANETSMISSLLKSGNVKILSEGDSDPEGFVKNHVSEEIQTYIKVVGLIDLKLEIERLTKRNVELNKLIEGINKKVNIPNYNEKVPENVRNENSEKLSKYQLEKVANDKSISDLSKFL